MKAILKNYRQSPRKVRLVGGLIKGKSAERALLILDTASKRANAMMKKVLSSAIANSGAEKGELKVKNVQVNEGPTLHRYRAGWRGIARPIRKRTSHVTLELEKITDKK